MVSLPARLAFFVYSVLVLLLTASSCINIGCQLSAYCPLEFSCLPVPFVYSVLPLIAPSCINVDCQLSAYRPLKVCCLLARVLPVLV